MREYAQDAPLLNSSSDKQTCEINLENVTYNDVEACVVK